MAANKYGNFLTILLIILIVAMLVGAGVFVYSFMVKPNSQEKKKIEAFAELDKNAEENKEENEDDLTNTVPMPDIDPIPDPEPNPNQNQGTIKKKTYYEGFVMLGYITIPKTKVKEPILDIVTQQSLDTAVAALYPSNPQLNKPGNVVIIGHNYRDGRFFSNNNKLSVGDKIKIKDVTGTELTYTIYQKFQTSDTDTSFYTRDTKGATEITLSTCTDDAKARIIILARAE